MEWQGVLSPIPLRKSIMTDPIPFKLDAPVHPAAQLRCANMVAVASGKGGVGKT